MKKIMLLALSAVFVANISAQEPRNECPGKPSKKERVEFEIKRLSHELYLDDRQAEKFAATYREYAAELDELFSKLERPAREEGKEPTEAELDQLAAKRFATTRAVAELKERFYARFREALNARQVAKVLHLDGPFGDKPCCGKCDGKHHGHHGEFGGGPAGKHAAFEGPAPRPENKEFRPENKESRRDDKPAKPAKKK